MKIITQTFGKSIFIVCCLIIIGVIIYKQVYISNREPLSNNTKYSNKDYWGFDEDNLLKKFDKTHVENYNSLTKKSFPVNTSYHVIKELEEIKNKQSTISKERISEIKKQINIDYTVPLFTKNKKIQDIIYKNLEDKVTPIIMKLKKHFNRARPYHLDNSIIPVITAPKHPSYPSGHSTESYYIAYNLGKLYPENKDIFLKTAKNIAENREYAGVHFKTDTEYGKLLGRELAELYPIS